MTARRTGIGAVAAVAAVISLVLCGGVAYVVIANPSFAGLGRSSPCVATTAIVVGNETTTTTIPCTLPSTSDDSSGGGPGGGNGGNNPGGGSTVATSQSSSSGSTNTSYLETFRVSFSWSGNTTTGTTTDVQHGSGNFVITIDLLTGVGSANGTGHVDLEESGLCAATNSTDYTFNVSGTLDPVSGNLTLDGGTPTPSEFTAVRSCTNPYQFPPDELSWPAFYPTQVTLPAKYGASVQGTIGGFIDYEVTLA